MNPRSVFQRFPWAFALLVSILLFLSGARAEAALADRVFTGRLDNGLKVILLENHRAPLATFQIWYRVGSRYEPWGKAGLSHLLEHMMFKGTTDVPADQFTTRIQKLGGEYNAFTGKDFTAYFEKMGAADIGVAVELEADRMHNLVLREEDFRTERMVVMEERRLRTETDPKAELHEQTTAAAFLAQPYHWPVIGWADNIERISLEDLTRHYRTYYVPSNAFVVAVGDFNSKALFETIKKAFGGIPAGAAPPFTQYVDPPQSGGRLVTLAREAQLPYVIMGWHAPNYGDPDAYPLEVLSAILSSGKTSRLYEALSRKDAVALEPDASYSFLSLDPDLFLVDAEMLPGKTPEEAIGKVEEVLKKVAAEPVSDHELEKAKNQLESSFVYQQDSIFSQAMLLAVYEISGDWRRIDEYVPSIRKVTAEDVKRAAGRVFGEDRRTTGILKPLGPPGGGEEGRRPGPVRGPVPGLPGGPIR